MITLKKGLTFLNDDKWQLLKNPISVKVPMLNLSFCISCKKLQVSPKYLMSWLKYFQSLWGLHNPKAIMMPLIQEKLNDSVGVAWYPPLANLFPTTMPEIGNLVYHLFSLQRRQKIPPSYRTTEKDQHVFSPPYASDTSDPHGKRRRTACKWYPLPFPALA